MSDKCVPTYETLIKEIEHGRIIMYIGNRTSTLD